MSAFRRGAALAACLSAAVITPAPAADLKVSVVIEGVEGRDLADELRAVSNVARQKDGYAAMAPLRRASEQDREILRMALRSKGYYAATVEPVLERDGLDVTVRYVVDPGQRFEISDYQIRYVDQADEDRPQDFAAIGASTAGDPTGDRLKELEEELLTHLWDNGFPSAQSNGRQVRANFETGTAVAVFPISTGPRARYGDIVVQGNEQTDPDYIRAIFREERGDLYSRQEIDAYRNQLSETALFRSISIEPAAVPPDGVTPIIVTVEERKHRTFGAGVSFSTDVGVGVTGYWEHRNWRGGAERLLARVAASSPRQEAELSFEDPLPRLPGSWRLGALVENEDTDAFSAQTATLGAGIKKLALDRNLELAAQIQYQYSIVTDLDGEEDEFSIVSFPLAAAYNNENDPLDPTEGFRTRLGVTPFVGDAQFTQVTLGGASRLSLGEDDRFVLAGRTQFGASYGASRGEIPATERFYAGGGGSVRGYAFQEAGPIDIDTGNPLGGASLAEANLEARFKVREKIQIAAFVDAGSVFASETPDFSGDLLVGAGLGVRYFTPIGPIRVDVAVPLDRRVVRDPSVLNDDGDPVTRFEDDPFQLYIALGQPF
jgi:translocation and assembly module TamA